MRKCVLCGAQTRGEVLVDLDDEPTFVPCCWGCYNDRVYGYGWPDYRDLALSLNEAIKGKR